MSRARTIEKRPIRNNIIIYILLIVSAPCCCEEAGNRENYYTHDQAWMLSFVHRLRRRHRQRHWTVNTDAAQMKTYKW